MTGHSMNKFGRAQNRIWKQSGIICNKAKPNYFLKSFFIGIERGFFVSELKLSSDEVWRAHVRYSKLVNVHRAILKTKLLSEKVIPSQFTVEKRWFKFSLIHVNFDENSLVSPKTTCENE